MFTTDKTFMVFGLCVREYICSHVCVYICKCLYAHTHPYIDLYIHKKITLPANGNL